MKHSVCIVVFCMLATIGIALGCSKKEAVDPSQQFVQEQFPKDQKNACDLLFDSAEQLGEILRSDKCEDLAKGLESAPKDLVDTYEKGLMDCQIMHMTRGEASDFAKTASPELNNKVIATAIVDKLIFENVCSDARIPPKAYQQFMERRARIYHDYFRKRAIAQSCTFYEGLSRVLSEHKEDCEVMANDFEKYLNEHLGEFNEIMQKQEAAGVHLFDTTDGQRDYGRCYSQISYIDSPYMACIKEQNMHFIMVNARMMQVTTDIQRQKFQQKATLEGGNPWLSVEENYIEGFARNVEVTNGDCKSMGEFLGRFIDAIEAGMDMIRAQDISKSLDPDMGPAKNRKKLVQSVFGKEAPVQKCMENAEVRKAYDKMVDGLNIRNLIQP